MPQTGDFEKDIDLLVQNVARLFAHEGNAKIVSVLSFSTISAAQTDFDNWNNGTNIYTVYLEVPQLIYLEIRSELSDLAQLIKDRLGELMQRYERAWVGEVILSPQLIESQDWQENARDWLTGKGVNNQGRVRSDNIASRQCDGLLFRSMPEINIYKALKKRGIAFAPLPVFLKGGEKYSRIEPDFIVVKDGVALCLEIDGDTVHKESPAEADARTRILTDEGVVVKHFSASLCDTPDKADILAEEVITIIEKVKRNR